jgi:hypothetical protein
MAGFKGEVKRFGGDAANQRAKAWAHEFRPQGIVITGEGYKCNGVSPCYVVLESDSPIPSDATVVWNGRSSGPSPVASNYKVK